MGKFINDFKEFAIKGNVIDMAVGVIIGGAFGKIVTSMVNDMIMPLIGVITGGVNFTDLKWIIQPEKLAADGTTVESAAVSVNYGMFVQNVVDFLIIAFCIFVAIRLLSKLKRKKEEEPAAPAPAPEPTNEEKLLSEIRDLLKDKK